MPLYLLDSNDPANSPAFRGMTSELYGDGSELRLRQELILAIGGWRLLKGLGIKPEVCHLNEGHAAFAVIERARDFMEQSGQPFAVALAATRAGNLFTTHTPVPVGLPLWSGPDRALSQVLCGASVGLGINDLMALGRKNPANPTEPFNMAYLAIHESGAVNGVSRLHGEEAGTSFSRFFRAGRGPRCLSAMSPTASICRAGIRSQPTSSGPSEWRDRWRGTMEHVAARAGPIRSSGRCAAANRMQLVEYVCLRLARDAPRPARAITSGQVFFYSYTLTIGFARRFATYKRPNLLLHDLERWSES